MTLTDLEPGSAGGGYEGHLLDVSGLSVEFRTREGVARAVSNVSFTLDEGETLAILGESGCGKSVTAQAIMGILDTPPGFVTAGSVAFRGTDLLTLPEDERRKYRGDRISMIFQDALSALNPVYTVGRRADAKARAIELMDEVRIPAAKERVNDYPHQFSGGMRQRIMIAMALSLDPDIVIADEPTTALDVTVQAQIMELLAEQQAERNMGLILITHDLGVVADVADKITVMYAGQVVEQSPIADLYSHPLHPYSRGLLNSIPRIDHKGEILYAIKGLPPNLTKIPPGCSFAPRCEFAQDRCREGDPPALRLIEGERRSACHFTEELRDAAH